MKLAHLLDPRLIFLGQEFSSLDEAISRAVAAAADVHRHSIHRDEALSRVREREALGGTLLPTGVAIPHARLEEFEDLVIVPVVPRTAIGGGENATPIRMVWLLLTSKTGSSLYLNALAAIAAIAKNEDFLASLLRAENPLQFMGLLEDAGYEVKKGLHVEDIMSREVISVREDATLSELIDLMYAKKLRYVPVIDASEKLVGEIGVLDLIAAGLPDYASRLVNLDFLEELEPMEGLLAKESVIPVRAIMKVPTGVLEPSSSVFEAALRMTRSRKRHFPVAEGGKLVGVVSSMDILSKVLRP